MAVTDSSQRFVVPATVRVMAWLLIEFAGESVLISEYLKVQPVVNLRIQLFHDITVLYGRNGQYCPISTCDLMVSYAHIQ